MAVCPRFLHKILANDRGAGGLRCRAYVMGQTTAQETGMPSHHLLGISGSLRQASTNTALVREAARLFDPADFTLADLNMPLKWQVMIFTSLP